MPIKDNVLSAVPVKIQNSSLFAGSKQNICAGRVARMVESSLFGHSVWWFGGLIYDNTLAQLCGKTAIQLCRRARLVGYVPWWVDAN